MQVQGSLLRVEFPIYFLNMVQGIIVLFSIHKVVLLFDRHK